MKTGDEAQILAHEAAHIKQYHFIDLILIEMTCIFQWFNPVIWLYKRSLKITHEYLADQEVLKSGTEKTRYYRLLPEQTAGLHFELLTSPFHHSPLKKRITMMTKTANIRKNALKVCFSLPLFVGLILTFSCSPKLASNAIDPVVTKMLAKKDARYKEFDTNPDQLAAYKNGDEGIAAYFLSTLNFNKEWKSKVTDNSVIKISIYIDETGNVASSSIIFINQGSYLSDDFPNLFKSMDA